MRLLIGLLSFLFAQVAFAGAVITYHGRLLAPNGSPVENSNVSFNIRVLSPKLLGSCVLYEEQRTLNMTGSAGAFVIAIGDGDGIRTDNDPGFQIEKVFTNSSGTVFTKPSGWSVSKYFCNSGNSYSPGALDGRQLVVSFKDGSGNWQTLPNMEVTFVPFAVSAYDSQNVGGVPSQNLLRVDGAIAAPLSSTDFLELQKLIDGSSASFGGGGAGSVTAVTAGSGLSGGTITDTGTIAIAAGGVGSAHLADSSVTNAKLASGAVTNDKVVSIDWSKVTSVPSAVQNAGTDIVALQNSLATTNSNLSTTNTNLGTTNSNLATTNTNLSNLATTVNGKITQPSSCSAGQFLSFVSVSDWTCVNSPSSADKLPLAGGTMTGPLNMGAQAVNNVLTLQAGAVSTHTVVLSGTVPATPPEGSVWYDAGVLKYRGPSSDLSIGTVNGSGTVTQITAGAGLTTTSGSTTAGGDISTSGSLYLTNTGVTAGTYGSATTVPVFEVDAQGRVKTVSATTISGVAPAGAAGGDLGGDYPNPSVDRIKGQTVSATATTAGQVLRYSGSQWTPSSVRLSELASSTGVAGSAFNATGCLASQTLNWSSITDKLECQSIGSLNASVLTAGTVDDARLPASAKYWQAATGGINYSTGNVGIGSNSPVAKLDVNGGSVLRSVGATAAGGTTVLSDPVTAHQGGLFMTNSAAFVTGTASNYAYKFSSAFTGAQANSILKIGLVEASAPNTFLSNELTLKNGRVGIGTAAPNERLSVAGVIESTTGGIKFPDGTTQTTAATSGGGTEVSFHVTKSSVQSLSAGTPTLVTWQNKVLDTGSYFDMGTGRFQPASSGRYLIHFSAGTSTSVPDGGNLRGAILKNGTAVASRVTHAVRSDEAITTTVTALVDLNGSSDYVDFQISTGSSSQNVSNGIALTFAQGFKVGTSGGGGSGSDNLGNHSASQNINLNGHKIINGSSAEGIFIDSAGQVGVGTGAPQAALDVAGNIRVLSSSTMTGVGSAGGFRIFNSQSSNQDYLSIGWMGEDIYGIQSSDESTHRNLLLNPYGGNVGLGIQTAPVAKLDVAGGIKMGSHTTCDGTTEGTQRYNSTSKAMEFCNGTTWVSMSSGGGGGLGVGQSWTNVLASRVAGTNYTNSTGKPIQVSVSAAVNGTGSYCGTRMIVQGVEIGFQHSGGSGYAQNTSMSAVVPDGATYSVTTTCTSLSHWAELR